LPRTGTTLSRLPPRQIKQVVTWPRLAPAPMLSTPHLGADHIGATPKQGQVHFVGSKPDPCAVMPMRRGQEAAHPPFRGQPNLIFFSFLTAHIQKNQTVMPRADLFISIHPHLTSILLHSTHRRVDRCVAGARTALRTQSAGHHPTVSPTSRCNGRNRAKLIRNSKVATGRGGAVAMEHPHNYEGE
jgi:hypothetical protein